MYEFRSNRFILTRFPADHPVKVFAIPDGVSEIESDAFRDCARLKLLTFPKSVTEIALDAFIDCPNLTLDVQEGSFALEYARKHAIRFAVV